MTSLHFVNDDDLIRELEMRVHHRAEGKCPHCMRPLDQHKAPNHGDGCKGYYVEVRAANVTYLDVLEKEGDNVVLGITKR